MRISLSPQRRDDTLALSKAGDVLTVNGEQFDFSSLPDGATLPAGKVPCDWITGPVERVGGELQLTLLLPLGPPPWSANVSHPQPLTVAADGPITLPANTSEGADHVDA